MIVESDALPLLLRHMVLAIYKKKGRGAAAFSAAMDIARSQLVLYGYLTKPSAEGPLSRVRLTSKGTRKDAEHRADKGRARKVQAFKTLYDKHRATYEAKTDKRTDAKESDRRDV